MVQGQIMTFCLIVAATDGFMAIADGRRGRLTGEAGVYEWLSDDDQKVVALPGFPIVALTSGRASFNRRANAEVLQEVFARMNMPADARVRAAAEACRSAFTRLDADYPDPDEVGITTLVAGYESTGSFAAFRLDVPRKVMNPNTVDETTYDLRSVELDPGLPVIANPAETEAGLDVIAVFDEYFDDIDSETYGSGGIAAQYRFAGQDLDEMRAGVLNLLRHWLEERSVVVAADGIGGNWLFAMVRPGVAVEMTQPLPLGPMGGR